MKYPIMFQLLLSYSSEDFYYYKYQSLLFEAIYQFALLEGGKQTMIDNKSHEKHSKEEKLKAAYALNLCTVSVSQIVDYNDVYILEQEYDAILNNLNLKEIPKDEALLRILSELLNVITFFRTQNIKKKKIEEKYQQRIKDAIWSAIPNFSVIVSGSPFAIAYSLATQIGTGYMNYRREKNQAVTAKKDAEIELQITAIEQLNALKRELFTAAWRLADEYNFDDEWRLTEKQIEQYNNILQDTNYIRKYARLEAIANKFEAYPPFWYFYGHTANLIAENTRDRMKKNKQEGTKEKDQYYQDHALLHQYRELAKRHYEYYYSITKNNILREDQLTASCALEYIDLLWEDENKDIGKIHDLLKLAEKMSPNSFDIIQLCAISYMKIGESADASRLLKILINEDYNTSINAKLLSRIYVSEYLNNKSTKAQIDYRLLATQVDSVYLYPMPTTPQITANNKESQLEDNFLRTQKDILKESYRFSLLKYFRKWEGEFNSIIPAPIKISDSEKNSYYGHTSTALDRRKADAKKALSNSRSKCEYIGFLQGRGFRLGFTEVLNKTVAGLEKLPCFRTLETHDNLVYLIEARLRQARNKLTNIQSKLDDGSFSYEDFEDLVDNYSYLYFTGNFFYKLTEKISALIDSASNFEPIGQLEQGLSDFCDYHNLPSPDEYLHMFKTIEKAPMDYSQIIFFDSELLGEEPGGQDIEKMRDKMKKILQDHSDGLVQDGGTTHILDDMEFSAYFQNDNLRTQGGFLYKVKQKAFAILDSKSKRNMDLIFCTDGIAVVDKNNIRDTVSYCNIQYSENNNNEKLKLGFPYEFTNKDVNLGKLYGIIKCLDDYVNKPQKQ